MIDFELISSHLPQIYLGLFETLKVTFFSFAIGLTFGCLLGVLQARGPLIARILVSIYTTLFRGTPMLVQISFFYFFLPYAGFSLSGVASACLAIGLNSSAYISQIVRSGINAINQDELDAAQVLGFSSIQKTRYIILPQAIRNSLPALTNESITLLKDSSLASVIGVAEIYKELRGVLNQSYDVITVFFLLAVIYLSLTGILTVCSYIISRKMDYANN